MMTRLPGLARELVDAGLLGQDQARVLLFEQKRTSKNLEELVVEFGFLDTRVLQDFLSRESRIQLFCAKTSSPDTHLLSQFPFKDALAHKVLPWRLDGDTLTVAMVDVHNVVSFDAIRGAFGSQIQIIPHLTPLDLFLEQLDTSYARRMDLGYLLASLETKESAQGVGESRSPAQNFVDAILTKAVREKASDIHLEPDHAFVRVRQRIDGVLQPAVTFHKEHWSSICVCLKILSSLNIAETRLPQGGRFSQTIAGRTVDFRVSTHPTQHGESIVLRLLDRLHGLKGLDELGFSLKQVEILKSSLSCPDGMILLTGPTGSGKTTTLYSMLAHLKAATSNIMTLEEPIEYSLPGVRQSEVKELGGVAFPEGVRSMLRQDPDVILIGEIRDQETATMALRAAMTGHLVLSTLHTNDTLGVVQRLKDLKVDAHLLEGHLLCLVAQRLVRCLCEACKGTSKTPIGCEACAFTGYKGRFALGEVLPMTLTLERDLIQGKSKALILEDLKAQGFETLWQRGLAAVEAGYTSLEEVRRVVRPENWECGRG